MVLSRASSRMEGRLARGKVTMSTANTRMGGGASGWTGGHMLVRGARQEEAGGGGLGGARWPQYAPAVTLSIQPGMLRVIGEQKPPCCGEKAMRWERTVAM